MSTRKFIKKLTASLLFIAVVMSFGVQSAFAESNSPKATVKNNVVTFSNLDQLKANEKLTIAVVDSNGDPATITIEFSGQFNFSCSEIVEFLEGFV